MVKAKNSACSPGLVSIIIPVPGENCQPNSLKQYYLSGLKRLLRDHLPGQTHKNYEAIVYCDGPNKEIESLVNCLRDQRVKVHTLEKYTGLFGHPQTRKGIMAAKGDLFVRMNCDNRPYPEYLEVLVNGFDDDIGIVYGRTVFKGKARRDHEVNFSDKYRGISNEMRAFIIPRDKRGLLKETNIDCMNYMVKTDLARKYSNAWNDDFAADWFFIERLLQEGTKARFIDRLIGEKA